MEPRGHDALATFAREHHVHYEVEPEEVVEAQGRALVGVRLRLFASHAATPKLEAPGCERCDELLGELRSFAEELVRAGGAESRAEIVPPVPKLYQSTEDRDVDEVALTLRVHCDSPAHRTQEAGEEDRCLGELRERLSAAGVPRR